MKLLNKLAFAELNKFIRNIHWKLLLNKSYFIKYILFVVSINLEDDKRTSLTNGRIELDNNAAERQAKKFFIDRKNFLFSRSENGAKSSYILLTIIDLAYENKLEPRAYLEYVLDHVREQDFENLLPWSKTIKEKIQNIK